MNIYMAKINIYDNYIVTFCKIKYIYERYNKEKFILTNKELRVE